MRRTTSSSYDFALRLGAGREPAGIVRALRKCLKAGKVAFGEMTVGRGVAGRMNNNGDNRLMRVVSGPAGPDDPELLTADWQVVNLEERNWSGG